MNYIAKTKCVLMMIAAACAACGAPATESVAAGDPLTYTVLYTVVPRPSLGTADVAMQVTQSRRLLREVRFSADPRISNIRADGEVRTEAGQIIWRPAASGGALHWTASVANKRSGNGYDAWLGDEWGLLRAEDVVPRATTRTLRGASSKTTLRFDLPHGWTVVTPYFGRDGRFEIKKAHRRFDQPDGWIVMGRLGIRRDTIAGIRVAVAGPVDHAIRRMDILALLNWTLPELSRVLPELPPRLTIVSAGSPMWRGGLSAPQSLYMHAERPLISENATSTLLHEVMHSALRIATKEGHDWIVEGLAEYYSLELLRRSGSITRARHATALKDQMTWSKSAGNLCQRSSTGAATARAVVVFSALDAEIQAATDGAASLDDLLRQLQLLQQPVDLQSLTQIAERLTNRKLDAIDINNLPGCRSIESGNQENN